jgi:hypothetical protein
MFEFSAFALSSSDWHTFGALLVLVVVAKAAKAETRTLLAAVAGAIVSPTPATFYVVALLTLVWMFFDSLHLGRS